MDRTEGIGIDTNGVQIFHVWVGRVKGCRQDRRGAGKFAAKAAGIIAAGMAQQSQSTRRIVSVLTNLRLAS